MQTEGRKENREGLQSWGGGKGSVGSAVEE